MINFENVSFNYISFQKDAGIRGALKDFIKRKYILNKALKDISFNVDKGEIIGLLGPNGAGKTTLIKLLVGLIEPAEGKIQVIGYNPYKKNKKFLSQVGLIMGQKSQLTWELPALDTLNLLKSIYKINTEDFKKRLNYLVELLNIKDKLTVPVRKLSLGERMKFEIIASVIHYPQILILDEPTIGLDIESQRAIHYFLKHLNETEKTTIIITSHYMKDIEALSKRLLIIIDGQLKYDGNVRSLINSYNERNTLIINSFDRIPNEILGFKVTKENNNSYEITIANDNELNNIMKYLINNYNINSFYSREIPLEDIIFNIFTETR